MGKHGKLSVKPCPATRKGFSSTPQMQHHRTVRGAKLGWAHNGQRWKDRSRLIKLRLTASIHFSQSFKDEKMLTEASLQVQSSLDLPEVMQPWGASESRAGWQQDTSKSLTGGWQLWIICSWEVSKRNWAFNFSVCDSYRLRKRFFSQYWAGLVQ